MMKRGVLFLIFCLIQFNIWADEDTCCGTDSRKAEKLYNKAMETLHSGSRREAYKLLIESLKIDPEYPDANFVLGEINFKKSEKASAPLKKQQFQNRAYKYFVKVVEKCSACNDYESAFYSGFIEYQKRDFAKAEQHLEQYKNNSQNFVFKKDCEEALKRIRVYNELVNNPVEYNPVKLGGISTEDDEFLPMISPDGELAIFTHRYVYKGSGNPRLIEELSISKKTSSIQDINEMFSKGKPMPYPFNEEGLDQGAMSMTIDNKELYITICKMAKSRSGAFRNCDIYVSYFKDDKWSKLVNLGPNINGKYSWESQPSISADGKTLYFASVRPENIGFDYDNNQSSDIYYATRNENGQWGKAQNIGRPINTEGNEKSPFIHTDSRTLYFSSDEHPGIGGYDIFYAKETPKGWSKPKNIGYPINKEADEVGFFVSTNGKKAYFSSDKLEDVKRWNIYSFDLYKEARPEKVLFTKGQLVDEAGNALTDAKVEIRTSNSDKVVEGMVDKKTGDYAIAVAVEQEEEVLMTVKKEGHAFSSKYIKIDKQEVTEEPLEVNLEVKKVETGKTVQINDIHYATNSAVFKEGSEFILNNFVSYLKDYPNVKIEIHGHTDNVGNDASNQKLSEARAKSVRDYLVEQGISEGRIIAYKGFGESKPIADNKTESGRAKNRRTEFVIVAY